MAWNQTQFLLFVVLIQTTMYILHYYYLTSFIQQKISQYSRKSEGLNNEYYYSDGPA